MKEWEETVKTLVWYVKGCPQADYYVLAISLQLECQYLVQDVLGFGYFMVPG